MLKTKKYKELICIDHAVSKEKFYLNWDNQLEMYVTSPKPEKNELGKYYASDSYISHTDSKASFIDKLYQLVKSYSVREKVNMIQSYNANVNSILDIGCGTGSFLVECKKRGWNINGIEPNDKAIELALSKLNLKNNKFEERIIFSDIQDIIQKEVRYDVITMWHVLEHVPNLEEYIGKLRTLLKKDGIIIIAVPNFKSFDAEYYREFWAAYDVPRHLWHFSKKSIQILFERSGMKVIETLPMKFDSYYVSLLSQKYKTGKSNMMKAFYIGFLSNIKARRSKESSSLVYLIKRTK